MQLKMTVVGLMFGLSSNAFSFWAEPFSIPTEDGLTSITGEIDYPDVCGKGCAELPAVIMVAGSGLFDRDAFLGISGTDRDFVFRDLAQEVTKDGIAAVRFDFRGVKCNIKTMPPCPECATSQKLLEHYASSCVDNSVRATVTPENLRSDVRQVFNFSASQPKLDASRLVVFAHSEGTEHTERLVALKEIKPKGLLFIGMVADSPVGAVHWQTTERFMRIFGWDSNQDGILTNAEIDAGFAADHFFADIGFKPDQFHSDTGSWTAESWRNALNDSYMQARDDALAHADNAPYPGPVTKPGDTIFSSYAWWKQWFSDSHRGADLLADYDGQLIAHNGDFDSQTMAPVQFGIMNQVIDQYRVRPKLVTHSGKGHTLSSPAPQRI